MENKKIELSRNITSGIFGNINKKFIKRDKWSSNEIKLFLYLIFNIQLNGELNIKIKPKDLGNKLSNDNHFEYLNKILNGIQTKKFFMKINESTFRSYSLFSYLEYNQAKDDIVIQFNKDLKEEIFNIKSFSKFELDEIMKLKSYYSIKTRLLLGAINNKYEHIIDIKRFKLIYQIPESYKLNMIESRILNVIKKENNEVLDIYFKKNGRAATHVVIKYDMKKIKKVSAVNNDFSDIILNEISRCKRNIYVSKSWNIAVEKQLKKLIKDHGEKYVIDILKDIYNNLKQDIQKSLCSYIKGIIENKKDDIKPDKPKQIEVLKEEKKPKILSELDNLKTKIVHNLMKNKKYDKIPDLENINCIDQANDYILKYSLKV